MAIPMDMLVGMRSGLMAVLMAIMSMSHRFVLMLMFVLLFAMATHINSPPFYYIFNILSLGFC
jgi:hypothetical protein